MTTGLRGVSKDRLREILRERVVDYDYKYNWCYHTWFNDIPRTKASVDPPPDYSQAWAQRMMIAHRDFYLSGTGQTDANCDRRAQGGCQIQTGATLNDTGNLFPDDVTPPAGETGRVMGASAWPADYNIRMTLAIDIIAPASPFNGAVRFGLRETCPATGDETTDNNFAMIAWDSTHGTFPTKWRGITKVNGGGVDTQCDTSVPDVNGSTVYVLDIWFGPDQIQQWIPYYFVNDQFIGRGPNFYPNVVSMKPYISAQCRSGGVPKVLQPRFFGIKQYYRHGE